MTIPHMALWAWGTVKSVLTDQTFCYTCTKI